MEIARLHAGLARVKMERNILRRTFSCRSRLISAYSGEAYCPCGLVWARPLRARYTQLGRVLSDISSERAMAVTRRPPSNTCTSAAF